MAFDDQHAHIICELVAKALNFFDTSVVGGISDWVSMLPLHVTFPAGENAESGIDSEVEAGGTSHFTQPRSSPSLASRKSKTRQIAHLIQCKLLCCGVRSLLVS